MKIVKEGILIIGMVIVWANINAQEFNDPATTTDWNQLWKSSFVQSNGALNAPGSTGWYWGINMNHSSNSATYRYNGQIAIKNDHDSPTMYFRSTNVDGIGDWAQVVYSRIGDPVDIARDNALGQLTLTGRSYVNSRIAGVNLKIDGVNLWQSITDNGDGNKFFVQYLGDETKRYFTVKPDGNVGIGTTSPSSKLEVDGTITSEEVKVEVVSAPDYVFAATYQLRSLKETEKYIKTNSHLPEIPSAKEMETNGVELGEMNMLLLKKIEELTLHLISLSETQEKNITAIAELKKENKELQTQINTTRK